RVLHVPRSGQHGRVVEQRKSSGACRSDRTNRSEKRSPFARNEVDKGEINLTSMEPANSGVDPRQSFDDPLLDGLLILCKLHDCTVSRASLSAGLPLPQQRLSLDLLPRAAARASLQARLLRRELGAISALNLPVL